MMRPCKAFALGFALVLGLAPMRHGLAQGGSILEATTVLGAPAAMHGNIDRFLRSNTPRAFAMGPNGGFGWQSRGGDAAFVEQRAIASCERRAGAGNCAIVLRDLSIVKPGREWSPMPPPNGIGISSMAHDTVPDNRFIWWGPQNALGVLVYGHGKGERPVQPRLVFPLEVAEQGEERVHRHDAPGNRRGGRPLRRQRTGERRGRRQGEGQGDGAKASHGSGSRG